MHATTCPNLEPTMRRLSLAAFLFSATFAVAADSHGELLFEDRFERSEKDDSKEEVGGGWGTNSKSRANGNKQVDLVDGAVHITMHKTADHGVSFTHPAEFRDGSILLKLKLREGDDFGINIADLKEKSVHAGHLCQAKFKAGKVTLTDMKTGQMRLDLRTKRQAGEKMSAEEQKLIKSRSQTFDAPLSAGEWHNIEMHIDGPQMIVKVDGQVVGEFESEGIAHPTKRLLRLAVNNQAWVDDVRVYKRK